MWGEVIAAKLAYVAVGGYPLPAAQAVLNEKRTATPKAVKAIGIIIGSTYHTW